MAPVTPNESSVALSDKKGPVAQPITAAPHTDADPSLLLEARLQAALAERDRCHAELTLRNCALDAAIAHFGRRQRRFGLAPEQAGTR